MSASLVVLVLFTGCVIGPGTSVEQGYGGRTQPSRSVFRQFSPPRCVEIPSADYPKLAPTERPDRVTVRVDLLIDSNGRATELEAEVLEGPEVADAFVAAALAAAADLRCQPAHRNPQPGSGEIAPQPVAYKSALIYRFHRDGRPGRGSF